MVGKYLQLKGKKDSVKNPSLFASINHNDLMLVQEASKILRISRPDFIRLSVMQNTIRILKESEEND